MSVGMRVARGWAVVLPAVLMVSAVPEGHTRTAVPVAVYATCGTANDIPCLGAITSLTSGWSGNTTPHPLDDDIADAIDDVVDKFQPGSFVAVPRREKNGKPLWVSIEAIADAHNVDIFKLGHAVVIARLKRHRGEDDARDNRYNVGGKHSHYLIVTPASPNQARWDIVEMRDPWYSGPRARIVSAGDNYHKCMNSDAQRTRPFAWFLSCEAAAKLNFEMIIAAKTAGLPTRPQIEEFIKTYPSDLHDWVRMAINNDELIWITCGLGCCST